LDCPVLFSSRREYERARSFASAQSSFFFWRRGEVGIEHCRSFFTVFAVSAAVATSGNTSAAAGAANDVEWRVMVGPPRIEPILALLQSVTKNKKNRRVQS
jgi:hypothetical protein